MNKRSGKPILPAVLSLLFLLWTLAVIRLDIRPIGPEGSFVGLGALNGAFHRLTGVHMGLYALTDWLGLLPLFIALGFALLGLGQLIRRKSLFKVDWDILILGCFYVLVLAAFLFFETHIINYRPVLIGGVLEASYPSSTTLLILCIMPTARRQLESRLRPGKLRRALSGGCLAFTFFMVAGRLISGVHWLSDIIGGILLSAALVTLYDCVCSLLTRLKTAKP